MVNAILDRREATTWDEYKQLVPLFNKAAEQTQKAGIQFCYHNHNFEFTKFGDTTAFDFFLKELDPKLVQFEMDCFWATYAGQDPVKYFEKYPGRFPLLHIKDFKSGFPTSTSNFPYDKANNPFAPAGKGRIDWARIFAHAPQAGVRHIFVEQDICDTDPFDAAQTSFNYLKDLRLA